MKKLFLLFTVLLLAATAVSTLQISNPVLKGARGSDVTATLTIKNDGTRTVSNVQFTTTADSRYQIKFENVPTSLAPGASASVKIKGFVPTDFASGKRDIGKITVTSTNASSGNPFNSHNFTPSTENPQQVVLPVGMSASNDCGQNTPDAGMPIIGQWHSGTCDWIPDIEVRQPFEASVDAGWARIHSNDFKDYWINTVSVDCGGQAQVPPQNWLYGGKIHSSPGKCDGNIELPGADSGWTGFYSKPDADGQLLLVIAGDKCGGGIQQVPADGIILGTVRTGPGKCDGVPEAFAYNGASLDSGLMHIVYQFINHTSPSNSLPIGEFHSLSWASLSGWANDTDAPSINVNVYVDGVFWKELTSGESGFSHDFTQAEISSLDQSIDHEFSVYAIDSPTGESVLLNGSPKTLQAVGNQSTNQSNSTSGNSTGNNSGNTGNPNASNTATATLFMEATNNLLIERVKISCDKLETVNDGDTIDGVSPGQTCQLTVRVENAFTDDTEIEDIKVEAEPENGDVDGDDDTISSLDARDKREVTLELKVDKNADDGKVDIEITAEGRDERGVKHSDKFEFTLDIERLKHDLQISRIVVNPTQARVCEHSRVDVSVYVENKGLRDEDKVAVELSVPGLNFVKKISDLSIAEDEEERITFSVPIPSSVSVGSFTATAKSFFENVAESDTSTANIVIMSCSSSQNTGSSSNSGGVIVVPPAGTGTTSVSDPVVAPPPFVPQDGIVVIPPKNQTNSTFWGSAIFTGILVAGNLVALTVLGVMGYGYFKKKSAREEAEQQFEDEKPFELKDYY